MAEEGSGVQRSTPVRYLITPILISGFLQECDNLWWDAFTTEFFEDDAMLTITFCLEDGPKRYSKCPLWETVLRLLCSS
jgi:hypothetical protein